MAAPGIISGGKLGQLFKSVSDSTEPESNLGVFGRNPGATPKYAFNDPGRARDAEYRETMARLFIEMPASRIDAFLKTVSPQTRPLAKVLTTATGSGGAGGTGFIDFLMTNAQEGFQEKTQIVDTLTDNYVAFYSGQEPPVFSYSGTLLNTYQDDQRVWMLRLYREILRGTRLASRRLIARLRYDSFIVSGYLENLVLALDGQTDHNASYFQFNMRVKRMQVITPSLGGPTVLDKNSTDNTVIDTNENLASTERTGVVSPTTPPTALAGPAASTPATINATNRQILKEKGLTDQQINDIFSLASSQSLVPETDSRELARTQSLQGTDRVSENVQGTDSDLTNPENATNDANGGLTNVMGTITESETTKLQRRSGNRSRGNRAA